MNLQIAPVNGLIFVIGCLVGYVVYRRTMNSLDTPRPSGDLAAAITAAAAAVAVLVVLLAPASSQATDEAPTRGTVPAPARD
ncbi:hypothetical protein AB0I82_36130 [Streptomyces sp. NPDC050315]|uniref:hypothetical protein n=1 Tax=Streptomyces sp. NPDC050315 TaxID=3155039 RepID=UPI0034191AED